MVHQFCDQTAMHSAKKTKLIHDRKYFFAKLLFDHVVIENDRHDSESDDCARVPEQISDLLVIEANNVLSVDFQQLMVSEQPENLNLKMTRKIKSKLFLPISSSRGVLDQACDFALAKIEADVVSRVFVQDHRSLEGPGNAYVSKLEPQT